MSDFTSSTPPVSFHGWAGIRTLFSRVLVHHSIHNTTLGIRKVVAGTINRVVQRYSLSILPPQNPGTVQNQRVLLDYELDLLEQVEPQFLNLTFYWLAASPAPQHLILGCLPSSSPLSSSGYIQGSQPVLWCWGTRSSKNGCHKHIGTSLQSFRWLIPAISSRC